MALGTDVKIFVVGRNVFHASVQPDGSSKPRQAVVEEVLRGRVNIRYANGEVVSVSAQDRRLSLSYEECETMCELINWGRWSKKNP